MSVDTQWRYRNKISPNSTFKDAVDFFDSFYTGELDPNDVKAHKNNDAKYIEDQDTYLLEDRKTVIKLRRFKSIVDYDNWKNERLTLPRVDFNVSEEEGMDQAFLQIDLGPKAVGNTIPPMDWQLWDKSDRNTNRIQKEEEFK